MQLKASKQTEVRDCHYKTCTLNWAQAQKKSIVLKMKLFTAQKETVMARSLIPTSVLYQHQPAVLEGSV